MHKEIETLQRQAEALRKKEVPAVIARVKQAIEEYGLTAEDLGLESPPRAVNGRTGRGAAVRAADEPKPTAKPKGRKRAGKKKAGVVRYRDEAGNSWTGHGRRPSWFVAAIQAGK